MREKYLACAAMDSLARNVPKLKRFYKRLQASYLSLYGCELASADCAIMASVWRSAPLARVSLRQCESSFLPAGLTVSFRSHAYLMLAYYVHHFSPFIVNFGHGIGLRWYGTAYVLGFLLGYQLYVVLARRGFSALPPEKVPDLITGVCFWGVLVGGRLGYALFYNPSMFLEPLSLLRVWEGGMASHGGILGVGFYSLWYARRHKVSWMDVGDNLAIVATIGLFFGRCANFINGELYGRAAKVAWAVQFPKELLDPAADRLAEQAVMQCQTVVDPGLNTPHRIVEASQTNPAVREVLSHILTPRHPSQLYEAGLEGLALFAILFWMRTRCRLAEGVITGAFFILYACFRIFGEQFRQPEIITFGLTHGQFLSLFMIVIGAGFIIYSTKRNRLSAHAAPQTKV